MCGQRLRKYEIGSRNSWKSTATLVLSSSAPPMMSKGESLPIIEKRKISQTRTSPTMILTSPTVTPTNPIMILTNPTVTPTNARQQPPTSRLLTAQAKQSHGFDFIETGYPDYAIASIVEMDHPEPIERRYRPNFEVRSGVRIDLQRLWPNVCQWHCSKSRETREWTKSWCVQWSSGGLCYRLARGLLWSLPGPGTPSYHR